MDGNGGCCVVRHAETAYRMSKVDKIMLKFRPIAPKPVNGMPCVGASVAPGNLKTVLGRKKRRYCGGVEKRSCGGGRRRKSSATRIGKMAVNTLPLLPETPDVKENTVSLGLRESFPFYLNHGQVQHVGRLVLADPEAALGRIESANGGSWVKVERVTDIWVSDCYGYQYDVGMGRSDEEKVMNLDVDTCPAFVSDGLNRVTWSNATYRGMVGGEAVEVVVEEGVVLPVDCAAFTCRVRLITTGKENKDLILAADVWKMESGGFAWRLDTKAALSLGW